jgi:hypothetical protein
MPRCECPFVPADVDGVARTSVVLQVVLIVAVTTTVLHVGCTGRRSHASAKLRLPEMLGEESSHTSLTTTQDV